MSFHRESLTNSRTHTVTPIEYKFKRNTRIHNPKKIHFIFVRRDTKQMIDLLVKLSWTEWIKNINRRQRKNFDSLFIISLSLGLFVKISEVFKVTVTDFICWKQYCATLMKLSLHILLETKLFNLIKIYVCFKFLTPPCYYYLKRLHK